MEAALYGILLENSKVIYLPQKSIKVPVVSQLYAKASDIGFQNIENLEDREFRYMRLLTGEELVTSDILTKIDYQHLESSLYRLLDGDARDAILVVNHNIVRVERVFDSSENKEKIFGNLLERFIEHVARKQSESVSR